MAGLFNTVVSKVPRRNAFSRSFENHLTTDFGKLVPVICEEVYPNDDYRLRTECVIKLAEMIAPAMARIDAYLHYFFVPTRLLYADWEKFITGGTDGTFPNGTQLQPVSPYVDFQTLVNAGFTDPNSLGDYLGLPSVDHNSGQVYYDIPPISILPFLAYQKIYSDYYRDELLTYVPEFAPYGSGDASTNVNYFCSLRYRSWKKDYFTSARPDTQLGPQVGIPISGEIAADGPFRLGTNSAFATTDAYLVSKGAQREEPTELPTPPREPKYLAPLVYCESPTVPVCCSTSEINTGNFRPPRY